MEADHSTSMFKAASNGLRDKSLKDLVIPGLETGKSNLKLSGAAGFKDHQEWLWSRLSWTNWN
jgi:hypothetical protein